jgi:hypothetical protein
MASGLSQEQLDRAEQVFGFRFPGEIRAFFGTAYPTHPGFFDYRDLSEENLLRFEQFQEKIRNSFLFDIQHNALAEELGITGFTKADNARQRGVSRMASLEVVLEKTDRIFSDEEKAELAEKKNDIYISL